MIKSIPMPGRLSLDVGGIVVIISTILGYLAPILAGLASLAAFVWYGIQIYYFLKDRK